MEARTGVFGYLAAALYEVAGALVVLVTVATTYGLLDSVGAVFFFGMFGMAMTGATICATVLFATLHRRRAPSSALAKVSVGLAIVVSLTSVVTLGWPLVGGVLVLVAFMLPALMVLAFLSLVIALRRNGSGVIGRPSAWDWMVVVTAALVVLSTLALLAVLNDVESVLWSGIAYGVTLVLFAATVAIAGWSVRADELVASPRWTRSWSVAGEHA